MTWTQSRDIGTADLTAVKGGTTYLVEFEALPAVSIRPRIQAFLDGIKDQVQKTNVANDALWNNTKEVNGFRIREIFSGEEDLTTLLTRYVERIAAVRY